jgi:hypothetical protein
MLFEKDFLSSADPSISGECGIKVLSTEQVLGVQGTSSRPLRKILWRLISERCRGLWMRERGAQQAMGWGQSRLASVALLGSLSNLQTSLKTQR